MKKVVAIVLALAMVLSFASFFASAHDVAKGQLFFGPKDIIYADAGTEATIELEFKADPNEEDIADLDLDGMLRLPFDIYADDVNYGLLKSFELSEEAKKIGATLEMGDFLEDGSYGCAFVTFPAKYIANGESIVLVNVKVDVSADWADVIDNYKAEFPVTFTMYVAEFAGPGETAKITSADGTQTDVFGFVTDAAIIEAKPYEPNFFEKIWEWIKKTIRSLIDLDNIIDNLLYTRVFQPADWYDDYMLRKNAAK